MGRWGEGIHTVEGAGYEEGGFGAGSVEDVDKLLGILIRPVVVGEGNLSRGRALGDNLCTRQFILTSFLLPINAPFQPQAPPSPSSAADLQEAQHW